VEVEQEEEMEASSACKCLNDNVFFVHFLPSLSLSFLFACLSPPVASAPRQRLSQLVAPERRKSDREHKAPKRFDELEEDGAVQEKQQSTTTTSKSNE